MKILKLVLKGKWYEMIESGQKTEEYREIKPYWIKRLCDESHVDKLGNLDCYIFNDYNVVKFSCGYSNKVMCFEIKSISIGVGKSEWGAPIKDVFIIKLGKKLY